MTDKPPYVCHVNENIEGAVYIGRAVPRQRLKHSKWANHYKIGIDGDRAKVIRTYRELQKGLLIIWGSEELTELTGKPLACWCRRSDEERTADNMCHGDVLVDLWKERFGDGQLT